MIKSYVSLLFCSLLAFNALQTKAQIASIQQQYQNELDHTVQLDRAVVAFQPNTPFADITAALEGSGATFQYQVPWPCITYIKLNPPAKNYTDLLQKLSSIQQNSKVIFANPILETVDHSGYGVLNEAIVKLKPTSNYQQLVKLAGDYHIDIKEKYAYINNAYILSFNKQSLANPLEVSLALKNTGLFVYAEPNYILNPLVATNDQFFTHQWNIVNDSNTVLSGGLHGTSRADMRVDSAWTITKGDSNITIAVIDAGVDTVHPDLLGQLVPGYDATGHGSHGYPNTDKGENAHGTSCTGIIVAKADNSIGIAGVANGCRVMPIRVFYYIDTSLAGVPLPNTPWSTALWMADAIGYAWQTGNVDVMSNSWGVPDILFTQIGDSNNINAVTDIVNQAATQGRGGKGIPILFSSGNYDPTTPYIPVTPIWPGRLAAAISVNATSMCDEPKSLVSCDHENWIGCYGDSLDISAPGVRVTTCDMHGNLGYSGGDYTFTFNGTSAACPNAAGVMALLLSERPDLTLDGAKYLLFSTADTVFSVDTNRYSTIKQYGPWSPHLGYGRINAYHALLAAQTYTGINNQSNGLPTGTLVKVYPNPANSNDINIAYQVQQSATVFISICNIDGQVVYSVEKGIHTVGQYQEKLFDTAIQLPTGMYIGRISFGAYQTPQTFRFVIAK